MKMNRKYVFIFSILLFLTIVSGFFFNASLIDTSPLMTNDPNNILVGSLCERLENDVDITGSIVQFENKILSVKNYENDKKTGKFNCISSNLIEPYVISESFSCAEGDLALSRQQTWRIKNKCRSYTSTVVKCSQYNDEFTNDISRINYTKYKNGEDIYSFDSLISSIDNRKFGRDYIKSNSNILRGYVDIPSTMNNSLLMSAMICSIVNNGPVSKISSLCLRRPNRKECYGKFDHNFVNFPETYFPTHDGPWGKSNPGYSGLNNFPDDLDTSKWKYFEFNNIGGNFRLNTDVGVRYNPQINLSNYDSDTVYEVSPFNPDNPGNLGSFELDNYHKISSFYYQAAREEIKSMQSQKNRIGSPQYYYDHLPRVFKGYGSPMSEYKNGGALTPDSGHPFQALCENGCRHLILTSHESCDKSYSTSTPENTEVHCLPKYLNIRRNRLLKADHKIFDISGYDSVRINDLVISFSPGAKSYEIHSAVAEGSSGAHRYFNYFLPRLSYYFYEQGVIDFTEPLSYPGLVNQSDPREDDFIFSFNNSYYRFLFSSYNEFVEINPPWIINKGLNSDGSKIYDAYQLAVINYFFFHNNFICKDFDLTNQTDDLGEVKYVDKTSCQGHSDVVVKRRCIMAAYRAQCNKKIIPTFLGNLPEFKPYHKLSMSSYLSSQKNVFLIHSVDKLIVSNTLFKGIAQTAFKTDARKNIFHGNRFQGYKISDLINRGVPVDSEKIGIKNYYNSGTNSALKYEGGFNNHYFSPIFIGSGNDEGHVRLDPNRLSYGEIDYPTEYPFLYNLCKSLDGSNPNPDYCDSKYNFSSTHKFSSEEFFSPFYFSSDTPENNARNAGENFNHYDNSLYLKKFNPFLFPNFLVSYDIDPLEPMSIGQVNGITMSSFDVDLPCSNHLDCGEDAVCYKDDGKYSAGLCITGDIRSEYIIVSNNTFKDHSFRNITYFVNNESGGTRRINYNHEFIATNGTHALIFNNVLHNHASDIYDLNFRGTHYRSEQNKNLIQVIERNLISNGDKGKATGEGNPESKMRFSNNVIHNVRIGGYHAFFTPFYLNNTILTNHLPILNDTQNRFANVESLKPYGVRHTFFNNAVVRARTDRSLIASPVQRAKQHAVDYNFSENLYFGEVTGNWMVGADDTSMAELDYFDVNIPMGNYSYVDKDNKPISVDEDTGNSTSCFGNYLLGGTSSECGSSLSIDTSGFLYGSFENYLFDSDRNNGFNYGKLKYKKSQGVDIFYGFSPSLDGFYPGSVNKNMPRVRFIASNCYEIAQQPGNVFKKRAPSAYSVKKSTTDNILSSYECITGDNKSTFYNENELNSLNQDVYFKIETALETKGTWGVVTAIKKNIGSIGCNVIQEKLSEDKRASIFVDAKGLSVHRDFSGKYRGVKSSSGSFNINCSP